MDARTMLLNGQYKEAIKEHGEDEVKYEIEEMIYHDLADKALLAAKAFGYEDLGKTAAAVVKNGNYS